MRAGRRLGGWETVKSELSRLRRYVFRTESSSRWTVWEFSSSGQLGRQVGRQAGRQQTDSRPAGAWLQWLMGAGVGAESGRWPPGRAEYRSGRSYKYRQTTYCTPPSRHRLDNDAPSSLTCTFTGYVECCHCTRAGGTRGRRRRHRLRCPAHAVRTDPHHGLLALRLRSSHQS